MRKNLAFALALASSSVGAQTVPAIQPMPLVMEVDASGMGGKPLTITKQERAALNIAGKWIKHTGRPTPAGDGSVEYVFGTTAPTLVCTELHTCGVRFQVGERVISISLGDSHRWKWEHSAFGEGGSQTEVVTVRPTEPRIATNMIVTTDRRIYIILLKAAVHEWIPFISFTYPEDAAKIQNQQLAQRQKDSYSSTLSSGMNVANLDFGFRLTGDNVSWKPIRVYSDGKKTYVEFESLGNEAPALVELGGGGGLFSDPETKVVNYRLIGKRYVVDGTPKLMALIVGVGNNQRRVVIEKTGGSK